MWPHKIWQFWGGLGGVNYTDDLPLKLPRRFTPNRVIICTIYPPKITREDLPLKLPSMIYPKSSVQFTPSPQKSPGKIYPLKLPSTIYPPQNCQGRFTPSNHQVQLTPPPNHPVLSKISDTQHHALLHKGLFCERPIKTGWGKKAP